MKESPALPKTEREKATSCTLPSSRQRKGRQSRLSAFPALPLQPLLAKILERKKKTKQKPYNLGINILSKVSRGGNWSDCLLFLLFHTHFLKGKLSNWEQGIPEEQIFVLKVKETHLFVSRGDWFSVYRISGAIRM